MSHLFCSITGPLTSWNKHSLWQLWKLNQGTGMWKCNHKKPHYVGKTGWHSHSEWARSTQGKQVFNQQPWKRNRTGKNRVLVNKKCLGNSYSLSQFITSSNVLIQVGFFFFFWLNHILTQIPQINPINNDKKNLSKPAPCWTTPSVELLLAPRLHMGTFWQNSVTVTALVH